LTISNDNNGIYVPPASTFLDNRYGGYPFEFDFASSVSAFGMKIGATNYMQDLTAYDALNNVLGTIIIPDQVDTLAYPYTGFYGLSFSSTSIAKATLTANADDWFVIDDFTYAGNGNTQVPEPTTMLLLGLGLVGLAGVRRKFKN
jgi:hypothetical protein